MHTRSKSQSADQIVKPSAEVEDDSYSFPPGNGWGRRELLLLNVTFQYQENRAIRSFAKTMGWNSMNLVPDSLKMSIVLSGI
jgi:hypothetical protein